MTIVHQILGAAGPRDAVTDEARQFRATFAGFGWRGRDYAGRLAPGLSGFEALAEIDVQPEDVLLFHHSASIPQLGPLLTRPNPKLLVYHNITPAEYLWEHAPLIAAHCAVGRHQLAQLVTVADMAVGHSAFNARELAELGAQLTEILPVIVDLDRLGPAGGARSTMDGPPTILFVGRLSPHKRQDELIRAFGLYRSRHSSEAELLLIGERLSNRYVDQLSELARRWAPGAVRIESGLSAAELGERYRAASAFVCLSEHEGFCVPLLEAFHAGVPVIARPNAAIPEVAGDAAILVEDRDPAVLAELIDLVLSDGALRTELVRRGRERLEAYSRASLGPRLRALVEATAEAGAARLSRSGGKA